MKTEDAASLTPHLPFSYLCFNRCFSFLLNRTLSIVYCSGGRMMNVPSVARETLITAMIPKSFRITKSEAIRTENPPMVVKADARLAVPMFFRDI